MTLTSKFRLLSLAPMLLGQAVALSAQSESPTVRSGCAGGESLRVERLQSALVDFARVAEVAGAAPVQPRLILRPSGNRVGLLCPRELDGAPWIERFSGGGGASGLDVALVPFHLQAVENTGYPNERNNGARWAGRGLSAEIGGGIAARWDVLSASVAPTLIYQQNLAIDLVESAVTTRAGEFRNPWYSGIDLPQRFGPDPFWTVDPGQSYLRADAFGAAAGISTENLWFGPAVRNSILMGTAAPGFPHAFVGTSRPVNVGIGRLEGEIVWGRLAESDHFDDDPDNDRRHLSMLVLDFEPRWLPGLFLGLTRVYQYDIPESGLTARHYFPFLETPLKEGLTSPENPTGSEPDDQLISIFGRWVFPESGFEVYGEWARQDHAWNWDDFIQEPDHTQAYTLGLQKVIPGRSSWLRLAAELTHLQELRPPRVGRPIGVYYTHSQIRQGYTHRGQVLGAWIGPGGDSQYLGVDLFTRRGRSGLFLERVRRNALIYYTVFGGEGFRQDAELTGGLNHLFFWNDLEVDLGIAYSSRQNREFGAHGRNLSACIGLTWRP